MNTWISVNDKLPDDEMCVLIALDDGEVWTGFHESEGCAGLTDESQWYYTSADKISGTVTHWMTFPVPPNVEFSGGAPLHGAASAGT